MVVRAEGTEGRDFSAQLQLGETGASLPDFYPLVLIVQSLLVALLCNPFVLPYAKHLRPASQYSSGAGFILMIYIGNASNVKTLCLLITQAYEILHTLIMSMAGITLDF